MESTYVERLLREHLETAAAAARQQEWAKVLEQAKHALVLAPESTDAQLFRDAALRALGVPSVVTHQDAPSSLDELTEAVRQARSRFSDAKGLVRDVREVGGWAFAAIAALIPAVAAASAWIGDYVTETLLNEEKQERLSEGGSMLLFREPGFVLGATLPIVGYLLAVFAVGGLLGKYEARLSLRLRILANLLVVAAFLPFGALLFVGAWQSYNHLAVIIVTAIVTGLLALQFVSDVKSWRIQDHLRTRLPEEERLIREAERLKAELGPLLEQFGSVVERARQAIDKGDHDLAEQLTADGENLSAHIKQLRERYETAVQEATRYVRRTSELIGTPVAQPQPPSA